MEKLCIETGTQSRSVVRVSVWLPWIHGAGPTRTGGAGEAIRRGERGVWAMVCERERLCVSVRMEI